LSVIVRWYRSIVRSKYREVNVGKVAAIIGA
jgi:hypothetical protein